MKKVNNTNKLYIKRPKLSRLLHERLDNDLDLGYDYRNRLYSRYISSFMFKIKHLEVFIPYLDEMMTHLVEKTKEIKKTFAFAVHKDSRNIN